MGRASSLYTGCSTHHHLPILNNSLFLTQNGTHGLPGFAEAALAATSQGI
jgi:hypothetical protein